MVVAPAAPKLSLQCEAIAADTTTIRSLDWDRSRFDIEFGLRNGTTYNAFLVRGERTALIDTSHAKFRDTWIPLLKQQIDPTAIDVLIVSHTEPDHSGLIGDLIDLNPEIEIVGSKVALQFLKDQVHRPFKSRAVKSGEELDLGTNPESGIQHRFEFLSAPNLHWPDTIFSFDHGTGILYTCDAFGLHYCSDDVFDADPGAIAPDFRFYYDCLMGPNARSVLQALKRMDGLPEINTIAVGHGPLLRHHLSHWISDYREWSGQRSKGESYAAVCYLSQYGFSDRISQAIAHGIGKADAQVQLVDLRATDPQELTALVWAMPRLLWCRPGPRNRNRISRPRSEPCWRPCIPNNWWGCTTPSAATMNRSTPSPINCAARGRSKPSAHCGSNSCPRAATTNAVRSRAPTSASC